jgi:hypothetical protein
MADTSAFSATTVAAPAVASSGPIVSVRPSLGRKKAR